MHFILFNPSDDENFQYAMCFILSFLDLTEVHHQSFAVKDPKSRCPDQSCSSPAGQGWGAPHGHQTKLAPLHFPHLPC